MVHVRVVRVGVVAEVDQQPDGLLGWHVDGVLPALELWRDRAVSVLDDPEADTVDVEVVRQLALGRKTDWDNPDWSMLDMGGYGSGAYFVLKVAVAKNDLVLATWALSTARIRIPICRRTRSSG